MIRKSAKGQPNARAAARPPLWTPAVSGPDRLVGIGFRCWYAGYETGDIQCWELAWREYSAALGTASAKTALTELACWVRTVRQAARRPIQVFPAPCRSFCRDESMAISLIAACQQNACPAARACAAALLGSGQVDEPLESAQAFGAALDSLGQRLSSAALLAAATPGVTPDGKVLAH
jgi:hypothetical protein